MDERSEKIALCCDADYRNKLLDKRNQWLCPMENHELQVYHIMLRLPVRDMVDFERGDNGAS